MCKRKNSETTLHEQCTPKRPRWLRLSFSKSASSCSPFLQSSLSTRLAKPEPTLVDHETTPTTTHSNNNSCIGGGGSTTSTTIAANHDLVPTQQDHRFILNQSEPASPDSRCSSIDDDELPEPPMDLVLLPTLVYRPYSKVVLKTSPPFLADQQAFGGNFHHHNHNHNHNYPSLRRPKHQHQKEKEKQRHLLADHSNHGWKLKSDNDVDKDGASVASAAAAAAVATAVSLNQLPNADCIQMWVCCACETDNGGDVVWCTNKSCNHYTVNCLDCFSY